jgi:hypothetical protein
MGMNPFDKILKASNKQFSPINENENITKYVGHYRDYLGDDVSIETLFNDKDNTGLLTTRYNNQVVKVSYEAGGGGVTGFHFIAGDAYDLINVLLALASDGGTV